MNANPILLIGASVRALAQSARLAGFQPVAVDLFADRDLASICPVWRITDYPGDIESIAAKLPAMPWMYSGGLENYPDVVDRIAKSRPLLGNASGVLRRVRDPWLLAEAFHQSGIVTAGLCSAIRPPEPSIPAPRWLRKRIRSCGGMGIRWADDGDQHADLDGWGEADRFPADEVYFQAYVAGHPTSSVYVGDGFRASLLGCSQQLIGVDWAGSSGFRYVGSIGPLDLDAGERQQLVQIGNCIAERFGVRGLFGVDLIRTPDGFVPIEVNPRYTASVEILERASGRSFVAMHASMAGGNVIRASSGRPDEIAALTVPAIGSGIHGKAILFAREATHIDARFSRLLDNQNASEPQVADLPQVGTRIERGHPIATLFAAANSVAETIDILRQRAATFYDSCRTR